MTSMSAAAVPSARALRHLNNRNNVADLQLNKYLEQVQRQTDYYISDLDKDRLDVADFLKTLLRCNSDDLPQNKMVREDTDSDDDLYTNAGRNAHTAKTEPSRRRRRRRRRGLDNNDDDDDNLSVDGTPRYRQPNNAVRTRRHMLSQRRKEERMALESDFHKTEDFLSKLRLDLAQEQMENFQSGLTRKQFTAYLLMKIQSRGGPEDSREVEAEEEGTWAKARMDMVYPIRRLGDIATKFKQEQPSPDCSPALDEGIATRVRISSSSARKKAAGGQDERGEALPELRQGPGSRRGSGLKVDRRRAVSSPQKPLRHRSVFDVTDDDPPLSALPRYACMPDPTRATRDLVADTARAFGFGEAAVVVVRGQAARACTPPPEESPLPTGPPQFNAMSRASIVERRRLERQAKMKVTVPAKSRSRNTDADKSGDRRADALRALLQSQGSRGRPLNERIKDFMLDLDSRDTGQQPPASQEDLD